MPRRPAVRLLALLCAAGLAGPAHAATLALEHQSTDVTEITGADGILAPGDTIGITEHIVSSHADPLSGLTGSLSTQTAGVSILVGSSPLANVAFGETTTNSTLLRAAIGGGVECGQNVNFTLTVGTGGDSAQIPFKIGTGAPDAPNAHQSADVPHVIPNPGILLSDLPVADTGRVKDVRVHVGELRHPYVEDLRITLISPAGTRVLLFDRRGGSGDDLLATTFARQGVSLGAGSAPFTGLFAADGDLSTLIGERAQGTWRLEVNDTTPSDAGTLEAWGTELRPATCAPRPIAVASVNPNPVGVGQIALLDGSQSIDPTGDIVNYAWDLDGNGTYETDNGSDPLLAYSWASRQTVPVGLRITNNHGETSEASVTVSVTAAPTASFTHAPAEPLTGEPVTVDGSGSTDPDGVVSRWEWDLDGNGTYEAGGGASPTEVAYFDEPGEHLVRLRVTDDNGATGTATRTITIGNRPPLAALGGPDPALVGEVTTLTGATSADPDGFIISHQWDIDDDGTYDADTGEVPTLQTTFATPGARTVRLRVTDDQGATDVVTRTFAVTHRPTASLAADPNPARPNRVVGFAATASDLDGAIVRHEWDLDGDGSYEHDTGTDPAISRSFADTGAWTARLRVTDPDGATAVTTLAFSVVNQLPLAVLEVTPAPAPAGLPVTLNAGGSSDAEGAIAHYQWDLDGNGSYETDGGTSPTISRSYPNPGALTVKVRVTDTDGATATASRTLLVVPADTPTGGGQTGGAGGNTGTGQGGSTTNTGGGAAPGGSGGIVPGGPGVGGPTATPPGPPVAGLDGSPIQKIKAVRRSGVVLGCRADRSVVCRLVATISAKDAKRLKLAKKGKAGRKPLRVGKVEVVAPAGKATKLRIRLSAKVKRALKRTRSVMVLVTGRATDQANRSVALRRAVLVRR